MLKATKVRIYPTPEQADFLNRQFGAVRFVFNKALHIMSSRYKCHGQSLNAKRDLKPLLAVAKKSRRYHWLKNFDSIALQQGVINLDQAFQKFFDPKLTNKYPRFKRKHGRQSSYHCVGVKLGDDWIKVPKCQPIKARIHRPVEGALKSIALSRTATGKYYASLLVDDGIDATPPLTVVSEDRVLGLDMGISHIAIASNGVKTANPRFTQRAARNLKRKQQALSRKQNGSRGRAKARALVARCHEKVANTRNDFQHKLSRKLVDENQAIALETLKVKNMLKNRKLAKHIADASWHSLISKLEYKMKEKGKHVVKIDQWFASSKTCHCCGHKVEALPLDIRRWDCTNCGIKGMDRDINAALNIKQQGILKLKAEGLSVSANGGLRKTGETPAAAWEVGSLAR